MCDVSYILTSTSTVPIAKLIDNTFKEMHTTPTPKQYIRLMLQIVEEVVNVVLSHVPIYASQAGVKFSKGVKRDPGRTTFLIVCQDLTGELQRTQKGLNLEKHNRKLCILYILYTKTEKSSQVDQGCPHVVSIQQPWTQQCLFQTLNSSCFKKMFARTPAV